MFGKSLFQLIMVCALFSLSSCSLYKQHYMFQFEEDDLTSLSPIITSLEKNYKIAPLDRLEIDLFTHDGERIIDPEFQLGSGNRSQGAFQNNSSRRWNEFSVLQDSTIKLPLLGHLNLVGMTLDEAETYLQQKYEEYYTDPFVKLNYTNKRVILLGAAGGQILPLEDEKLNLAEVLALAGGINEGGKSHNIRVIRGQLNNPEVYLVDLSTIKGMKDSMIPIEPGDIIYIEPQRKIVTESLRDFTFILATITNVVTMIYLINRIE